VLCTGLRGAGDGGVAGAVTAGIDALATGAPDEPAAGGEAPWPDAPWPDTPWPDAPWLAPWPEPPGGVVPGGGGGGAVPTPNRPGEAVGEDGSASGAACAACWALVRSATSESVSFFIASVSAGAGLGGTVDMFG
jgi:hypothetical protein